MWHFAYHPSLLLFSSTLVLCWVWRSGSRTRGSPPGPPTVPVIGNLHIFPKRHLQIKFSEWGSSSKQYGDIFSLKIFDQTVIVLNSPYSVREVIDKRSLSCSNRPKSIISDMIIPRGMNLGSGRFANETWKSLRKTTAQLLSPENFNKFIGCQHSEAIQLALDLAHDPEAWYFHIHRFTTSFATTIVYGRRSPRVNSPDVAEFLHVHPQFLCALDIGTFPPVDIFPVLRFVPERWAPWKRAVKDIRMLHNAFYGRLLRAVEDRLKQGKGNGAFMEEIITDAVNLGLNDREVLMNLGAVVIQGSDTTSAALQNIMLCLATNPDCQTKLQEELDQVVGGERVPNADDLQHLPYLKAFIEECNRFRPVGPLGLPHEMSDDEVVDGLLFEKDGMFHDERYFDQPEKFDPDRFLRNKFGVKEGVQDDPGRRSNLLFGGGRRVCPGITFARSSMEICTAITAWAFQILPAMNTTTGELILPNLDDYTHGITATPKPCKLRIIPRSPQYIDIIQRSFSEATANFVPYEAELDQEGINSKCQI
ncbi:cytochrome P450 [Suillus placidus]|uniref:Cytochrome P450 n=1 Tax=Suillus placidus TaxID=48579 RepID=A0A9P7A4D8_9AGAM|nr:cytochrome P450 [Suillus placidus]